MAYFRPKRIRALRVRFPIIDGRGAILDVGGAPGWWHLVEPRNKDITIINLDARLQQISVADGFKFVVADGRQLPFGDAQYDLVFSNSVIEHVGSFGDQRRFAQEVMRCGKTIYIQTPNRWFPIEPHLIAPLIHYFPFAIKRRLARWLSVWGWVTRPDQAAVDSFFKATRLMTRKELEQIFPDCEIDAEKIFWLTKSFIVTRGGLSTGA